MKDRIVNGLGTASLFSLGLFLLAFPQSVSVSQIFGGLTIATTYPLFFLEEESKRTWKRVCVPFLLFFGIYILLFVSSLIHAETYSPFFKKFLKQSEFGDFWMLLLFPAAFLVASKEKNQTILKRFLFASVSIAILLGCISLFSEVRLGKFVSNGFRYAPGDRLQHFSGKIGPIKLYLPIGMMNTHLTFGGLLGLVLPGLFVDWFQSLKGKKNFVFILKTFLVFAGFIILFFNQSRSVWLGVFVVFVLLILKGTFSLRKNLPAVSLKTKLITGLTLIVLFFGAGYLFRNNWLIQRSISQIFEVHNTENQRYYIYKNTIPLVKEHWLAGVGGGNYKDSHWKESSQMIEQAEQLWYELFITPRGHAHNDLLHFVTTGGIFAGILFLLFWGRLFVSFFQKNFDSTTGIPILAIGVLSLFPAGFFQCYLLDDEVVLPFFAFCGIFLGGRWNSLNDDEIADPNKNIQMQPNDSGLPFSLFKENKGLLWKTIGSIGVPILLYWLFWIPRLNLEPLEVYNRRVRSADLALIKEVQKNILKYEIDSEKNSYVNKNGAEPTAGMKLTIEQASLPFQVEGCLTHLYPNPPEPRKTPFSFAIYVPENSSNAPKTATITIVSRDSFDQDQLYWAHGESDLGTISVHLQKGKNEILVPNFLLDTHPKEFPTEVFFRDFKIRYSDYETGKSPDLPKLYFGRVCDTSIRLTR
ncbi:O-antigen ligase family protein [Leptospira barantonii]|uniref:Ligase n=1 Tax=Leptospira barantonii TaxID=2023184 RepID=A0ABX4NH60_9LEPT|nr:O-antigen ligase family protein [Leptospira barantonii]PJZ56146.1 ligase [Leptospira barantonii]